MGKTPLHYACEMGKSRCIPILLQRGASIDIRDKHSKLPIDLAANDKVRKIINVYAQNKGIVNENEEMEKRKEFSKIGKSSLRQSNQSELKGQSKPNSQIYTK